MEVSAAVMPTTRSAPQQDMANPHNSGPEAVPQHVGPTEDQHLHCRNGGAHLEVTIEKKKRNIYYLEFNVVFHR